MINYKLVWLILVTSILINGCINKTNEKNENQQLPNPASVYCKEQGGKLEIRTNPDGSQTGYCVLSDGSECEEWAFYRGGCKK